MKEEQVLFPYIRALAAAVDGDASLPPDMFGTIQNPIRMMEIEHQHVHRHVHLENNVLFPRAVELEARAEASPACEFDSHHGRDKNEAT